MRMDDFLAGLQGSKITSKTTDVNNGKQAESSLRT